MFERLLKFMHLQRGILMRINEDDKKRKNLTPLSIYYCLGLSSPGTGEHRYQCRVGQD